MTTFARAVCIAFAVATLGAITACSAPQHRLGLSRKINLERNVSSVGYLEVHNATIAIRAGSYDGFEYPDAGGTPQPRAAANGPTVAFSIDPKDRRFEGFFPVMRHARGGDLWLSEPRQHDIVNLSKSVIVKLPDQSSIADFLPLRNGAVIYSDGERRKLWGIPPRFAASRDKTFRLTDRDVVELANLDTSSDPNELAYCSDGHLWFTETNDARLGRVDLGSRASIRQRPQQFLISSENSVPIGIARGRDGTCWVSLRDAGKLLHLRTDRLVGKSDDDVRRMWNSTKGDLLEEVDLPDGAEPSEVMLGSDDNIWFVDDAGRVGYVGVDGRVAEIALPKNADPRGINDCGPTLICVANAWANEIEVIDTKTRTLIDKPMSMPLRSGDPYWIATADSSGPNSDPPRIAWFTEPHQTRLGAVDLAAQPPRVTEYALSDGSNVVPGTCDRKMLPDVVPQPSGVAVDRSGVVWFTEYALDRIGRFDPTASIGKLTEYDICDPASRRHRPAIPGQIIVASTGDVWFTETNANMIGRFDPRMGGFREYAIPTEGSVPQGIAEGPDGAIWFTESAANKIGRIALPDERVYEITVPTANSVPTSIVAGKGEGNRYLWFTEYSGNRIGRTTTFGHIDEFRLSTAFSEPMGIAAAADGAWFTEVGVSPDYSRVGHISNDGRIEESDMDGTPCAIAVLQRPASRGMRAREELWITQPDQRALYELGF